MNLFSQRQAFLATAAVPEKDAVERFGCAFVNVVNFFSMITEPHLKVSNVYRWGGQLSGILFHYNKEMDSCRLDLAL